MTTTEKITKAKQERASRIASQRTLMDGATDGELNADDAATFDNLQKEIEKLEGEIKRFEVTQARERSLENREQTLSGSDPSPPAPREGNGREVDPRAAAALAFARYGREGMQARHDNGAEMYAALQTRVDPDGGYLVPEEWAREMLRPIPEISVVRMLASVTQTASDRNIPFRKTRGTFAWVGEMGTYGTVSPTYGAVTLRAHKAGGIIQVSEELLQDEAYNLQAALQEDARDEFADLDETAFLTGDGVDKPKGLFETADVSGVTVENFTGAVAATATVTFDDVIETYYKLKKQYRSRASWIFADDVEKTLRKIKDGDSRYIWQPSVAADIPDRLLNRPAYVSDAAPAMAISSKSIVIGDIGQYRIVDRLGVTFQRLVEKYADTGQIGFKFSKRVDGQLGLAEAIATFTHGAAS